MITLVMLQKPLDPGPDPPSSRTARISSARRRYSVNFWEMASLILVFFSSGLLHILDRLFLEIAE
ncbi:hypothetical protein F2Q70_00013872 [Brassica cretica]|uniref:Uncharacterized protein n=1 Tax=Brassica cretica TaxID=69181 RepID=A0A8S9LZ73_BRACR|nr:hypothetical protein F2Q70_00013872 [Brassica cretica]